MRPIEDIISEKAYSELTEQELLEVAELAANEEEYNQMKRFFDSFNAEVQTGYSFQASPAVKESLDNIFMAKHPVIANDWNKEEVAHSAPVIPLYKRRSIQIAAILLLCLGAAPLLFRQETSFKLKENDGKAVAQKEEVITSTPADTYNDTNNPAPTDLPAGVQTNDNHPTLTANAEAKWAEVEDAAIIGNDSYEGTSAAPMTLSDGLKADLNPDFGFSEASVSDKGRSVTATASGSEMLDWIQAAY